MIYMNQYKLDWYLATQVVNNYVLNKSLGETTENSGNLTHVEVVDRALENTARAVMTWAVPTLLKHMAQNQINNKIGVMGRVGGRLGLRVVPVFGTLMIIKDAYDVYEFLTDP